MDATEYFENMIISAQGRHPSRRASVNVRQVDDLIEAQRQLKLMKRIAKIVDRADKALRREPQAFLEHGKLVLVFDAKFTVTDRTYSYAAIYIPGKGWYTTGSSCPRTGFPTLDHLLYYYHVISGTIERMEMVAPYHMTIL